MKRIKRKKKKKKKKPMTHFINKIQRTKTKQEQKAENPEGDKEKASEDSILMKAIKIMKSYNDGKCVCHRDKN